MTTINIAVIADITVDAIIMADEDVVNDSCTLHSDW